MPLKDREVASGLLDSITRRNLMKSSVGFAFAGAGLGRAARTANAGQENTTFAYVGTYSSPQGPEGSKGRGEGIYIFRVTPSSGVLTPLECCKNDANPSWLAFDRDRKYLFSANEISNYNGSKFGSVSAYSIDRSTGRLKLLNTVSSHGAGPTHLSVHPSNRFVLVANYFGGTIAVLPVGKNGELGEAVDVKEDPGPLGPPHAISAPPGSFAISGHDHPHAHMIEPDPSGRFVVHTDLASDRIYVWKFDSGTGKLSAAAEPYFQAPAGDGPRHFTFHPNGRWFYSLQEEASTLMFFEYDDQNGKLTLKQKISSLPKGFAGTNFTSEVRISPDRRFLYAANRLHDTIAWFPIGSDGRLSFGGEEWTRGDYPRSFTIEPSGSYLYSCNQRGDALVTFRVNKQTGALSFMNRYTAVGTPSSIVFLT